MADGGIVKKPKIAGNNPSVANATGQIVKQVQHQKTLQKVNATPSIF